jgi:hypothetical protein
MPTLYFHSRNNQDDLIHEFMAGMDCARAEKVIMDEANEIHTDLTTDIKVNHGTGDAR